MRVVERFLAANEWSTARKVAVTTVVWVPLQLAQYAVARVAAGWSELVDVRWFDYLYGVLVPVEIAVGLVAAHVARRGREGEWTFYALFTSYFSIAGVGAYAGGIANAATLMPLLVPVLVAPAFFGVRKSAFVLAASFVALTSAAVAPWAGADHAPALQTRSFDDLGSGALVVAGVGMLTPALVGGALFVMVLGEAFRRERAALAETRDQLSEAVGLISKYVPAEVAAGILAGTQQPTDAYRRQKVTAFFSDIVGFTDLSEELEPEDLATVLNEYFTEMAEIAHRHHGTVDDLQGDGLVLVFGAPNHVSDREHALDAVRAAVEMQEAVAGLNGRWRAEGIDAHISVRIGINTGVVTVGHFGSATRRKYTVLGKHVNLAARIQALCEPGCVLISKATWLLVNDIVATESLGDHAFRGITRPVEVLRLV
jgi:class 3 adenylate cyclase